MMKKLLLLGVLLLAGMAAFTAEPPNADWVTDFKAGLKSAKENNKKLFVLFTGPEWCPFCVELEKNVLKKEQFRQFAKDKLALVYLDMPRDRVRPPHRAAPGQDLAEKLEVEAMPTAVIFDGDGKEIGRIDSIYELGPYLKRIQTVLDKAPRK